MESRNNLSWCNKKHLLFILFASYTLGIYSTPAQGASDLFELPIEDLMSLPVITASRKLEKIQEAPATIIVITAKQIEERGYEYLDEILRDLPGFDLMHSWG